MQALIVMREEKITSRRLRVGLKSNVRGSGGSFLAFAAPKLPEFKMPDSTLIKIATQKLEVIESTREWTKTANQPEIEKDGKSMMPAPKPANWLEFYGSWENFCKAIHKSIGGKIGNGVLTFSEDWPPTAKKVSR